MNTNKEVQTDGLPEGLENMSRKELLEYAVQLGHNRDEIKGLGKGKLLAKLMNSVPQQEQTAPGSPTLTQAPPATATMAAKKVRTLSPLAAVFSALRKIKVDNKLIEAGFCPKLEEWVAYGRARSEKYVGAVVMVNGKANANRIYVVSFWPNQEVVLTEAVEKVLQAQGYAYKLESVESGPVFTLIS